MDTAQILFPKRVTQRIFFATAQDITIYIERDRVIWCAFALESRGKTDEKAKADSMSFFKFQKPNFWKIKKKIKKFFYQKTETSTIKFRKNDLFNVAFSKRSGIKGPKFGIFWRFSKFQTSIANYKIFFEFFHNLVNQNLGHLWSFYV